MIVGEELQLLLPLETPEDDEDDDEDAEDENLFVDDEMKPLAISKQR